MKSTQLSWHFIFPGDWSSHQCKALTYTSYMFPMMMFCSVRRSLPRRPNNLNVYEPQHNLGRGLRMHKTELQPIWTASSESGTYSLCEQRRFRRACASAQSRQNLRCSLIQAVNQEEPSDRKPDPWPLWMAGHAQLKFVMTECSKTQIRLPGPILLLTIPRLCFCYGSSSLSSVVHFILDFFVC